MAFEPHDREPLVTVDEHLQRVLDGIEPLPAFEQPLIEALGLPVCQQITSTMDVPSFDNSSMDGYAVRHEDLAGASEDSPVQLPVVGESAAGQSNVLGMSGGTAVRIMTGAPLPQGADAVVPVEWTDAGSASVRIDRQPEAGQHIRRRGDDISEGEVLLEAGDLIGPRQIGLLASVGLSRVPSRPRPRVVVISTGAELREPGGRLSHDTIYDSNSFMLAAAVRQAGAIAYRVGIVSDDPAEFADALSDQLVRADLVVTSGGVSKGAYDVVKEVLSQTGTVWFGGLRMQPGKPQGFGHVGEDRIPIFALPGNPVSSYVSFQAFVLPALRKMMGRTPVSRPRVRMEIDEGFRSPPGREQFVRARVHSGPGGLGSRVSPVGGHGSHLLGDLSVANALVVVPASDIVVDAGSMVDVMLLDQDF
jgi:molybdopterin molybdotransferase